MRNLAFYFLICLAAVSCTSHAQSTFATRIVKDSLFIPWEITYGPDDHIWFTQKNGYICRLDPVTSHLDTLYHETQTVIKNEGGMLGLALHPDFPTTPYVYVAYEYMSGSNYKERIVRYTYSGTHLGSPFILLDNITGANIHNGCRLLIVGDKLYIATGDAGNSAVAQNISAVNGKTLRINLDGSIPADNPIAGSAVWNWGQRNVQGMVFARGNIYSSMHGASADDEINILLKARNYGWPNVEGVCNTTSEVKFCADSNVVEPIFTWTPTIAPGGIDYYEHPMFPEFDNSILMTTLKDMHLYQLQLNPGLDSIKSTKIIAEVSYGRLRDICISPTGSIFISTSNSAAMGTGAYVDKIIELYNPDFTSVAEPVFQKHARIYPNPAGSMITIESKKMTTGKWGYTITDIQGKTVLSGAAVPPFNVALGGLDNGIYIIQCITGEGLKISERILKN